MSVYSFLFALIVAAAVLMFSSADPTTTEQLSEEDIFRNGTEEQQENKTADFAQCIVCIDDPQAENDTQRCNEMKPDKVRNIDMECVEQILPNLNTTDEIKEAICKNKNEEADKYVECITKKEDEAELTDEEKSQLREFIKCARKLRDKYCSSS